MRPLLAISFVLAVFMSSADCSPLSSTDRWDGLKDESDRQTSTFRGMLWEREMLLVHNQFWAQVYQACAPEARAAGIGSFKAVATVDRQGKVTEYLVNPNVPALRCFAKQMVGRQYPEPPAAPFYEVYGVTISSE
ncbi:hypothetical protein HEP73_04369 [Xanthomonas sp. GW]|uniref:hypothetical protein n=1 Tax=unclassified Xanthomonas TaxID=2643310 RepID=UPI0015C8BCC1|nr:MULTISPECIES: hypothetical protein [unclassified Xanthomonas]NYF22199.1 hypothetical protein [Xanthomonas sp. JAI131]QNH23416.1 hypothetical protein HEP73_04369 [Xanthomonas sp. GW]